MIIVILTAVVVFLIDLFTKKKVTDLASLGKLPESILGGKLHLKRVENPGMIMGLGKKYPLLVKLLPGCLLVLFVAATWKHVAKGSPVCKAGLGMLIGGCAGNVADHVRTGNVVDFIRSPRISKKGKNTHIYFNLADVGILIGAIMSFFK